MSRFCALVLACLLVGVSACQIIYPPGPATPTPRPTVTPMGRQATPTPTPITPLLPRSPLTLTVWLPDTLVPSPNAPALAMSEHQVAAFSSTRADVRVQTLVKRAKGPGSLLELIQTAGTVAPTFLPDVALIELSDVPAMAQAGLLHPLKNLPAEALSDLFPFAEAGRLDNNWVALAYTTDMEHLAYSFLRAPSAPITLGQVVSPTSPFLFPAGGTGVASDVLFAFYIAAGGRWADASGQPMLDMPALTLMLRYLKESQQAGALDTHNLNLASADDALKVYADSQLQLTVVRAGRFLVQRSSLPTTVVAPLPGIDGPAQPIARGWAWVVPTRDPARVALATTLVAWLTLPENEGAWARTANLLPARRAAFENWHPVDTYTTFVRRELDRAIAPPSAAVARTLGPLLQKAVSDVLRGQAQPAEAAAAAGASLGHMPK